jgi:hypothetical protein
MAQGASMPAGAQTDPRALAAAAAAMAPAAAASALAAAHEAVEALCRSAHRRPPTAANLSGWAALCSALLARGRPLLQVNRAIRGTKGV